MKLYGSTNVQTRVQVNGSAWALVFEGPTEEIEATFNGLYNSKGVGKRTRLQFTNDSRTLAFCWTTALRMAQFFINQYELNHLMHTSGNRFSYKYNEEKKIDFVYFEPNKHLMDRAKLYATNCLFQLVEESISFAPVGQNDFHWGGDENGLAVLTNKAERPDEEEEEKMVPIVPETVESLSCNDLEEQPA